MLLWGQIMKEPTITIIGGGVAGVGSALKLADLGYKVTLIEQRSELLSGSSNNTPCRIGLGLHYSDIDTSVRCLKAAVKLKREFKSFTRGNEQDKNDPLQHGRYFITKGSTFSALDILNHFQKIRGAYEELIKEDPANKVFGEPEDFFEFLSFDQFENDVSKEKVLVGIQTAEQVLDWPKLKKHLISKVDNHPNITVLRNTAVTGFEDHADGKRAILCENGKPIQQDFVINAAWENIEWIDRLAGIQSPIATRTNRTKVLIEVELPPELEKKNSMFFCFGPHCSFTNVGNGRGFITYEPVTNIESNTDLRLSEKSQRLMSGQATAKEKESYAQEIIKGVALYIPHMVKAKFTDQCQIKFGIVKTEGTVDIYSEKSSFHSRNYSGVKEKELGWVDNASMKLLYFLGNAAEVEKLVAQHTAAIQQVETIAVKVNEIAGGKNNIIKDAMTHNVKRSTSATNYTAPDNNLGNDNTIANGKIEISRPTPAFFKTIEATAIAKKAISPEILHSSVKKLNPLSREDQAALTTQTDKRWSAAQQSVKIEKSLQGLPREAIQSYENEQYEFLKKTVESIEQRIERRKIEWQKAQNNIKLKNTTQQPLLLTETRENHQLTPPPHSIVLAI